MSDKYPIKTKLQNPLQGAGKLSVILHFYLRSFIQCCEQFNYLV